MPDYDYIYNDAYLPNFHHDNLPYSDQCTLLLQPSYRHAYELYEQARDAREQLSNYDFPPWDRRWQGICVGVMLRATADMREKLAEQARGILMEREVDGFLGRVWMY
ncbi:hypothetical protein B0A55_06728 [Friedmanniomyces simplex]|uniref:Uncharacterized protein n=1 Tax=Friedmanniomyces simplex TaxID=329884 RepID=A0A4V5NF64_9PEZI|nr:hypothetical protein B0A55_06728 [Friedmanniomyces simplex]